MTDTIQLSAEVVQVTPDLAHKWLGKNTHNRRVKDGRVAGYAADMREGKWDLNGESIKFDINGKLLDGQNRLYAVIEANVTVAMLVITGLPPKAQESMDGGAGRSFADVLKLRSEHHNVELAAIVRLVTLWEHGWRGVTGGRAMATKAQMSHTLDRYPWLRDVARECGAIAKGCDLPKSVIGLCWWLFQQVDPTDCKHFFERLRDGQELSSGQAIYALRRTLANTAREVRGDRSPSYLTAITIKAWNAFREGRHVGVLSFRPGGANPEKFPEPK